MAAQSVSRGQKSSRLWLLIVAASLVPALLSALSSYLNSRFGRGRADWFGVAFAAGLWLFFGSLTPIIYLLSNCFPLRREIIGRTILAHLLGALVLCLSWTTLSISLALLLNLNPVREPFRHYYLSWVLTNLPWSVFLYFTVLGCIYAFAYYREAREREAQQARLAAQLAEARLGALRMQLNPHFLFNSLNAITVLVRDERSREASRMLELLSGILRQVLQSDTRQQVTLDEELRFLEKYLAIEQVRFSDRLQIKWSIEPQARLTMVPEFILQPLVENAVRHGVSKLGETGVIEITAQTTAHDLELQIQDNGPGYSPEARKGTRMGVGLANTRTRLETLYGPAALLEVGDAAEGGTVVRVRLPLRSRGHG